MTSNLVLVVDDDIGIRELLSEILTEEGYEVKEAADAREARLLYEQYRPQFSRFKTLSNGTQQFW